MNTQMLFLICLKLLGTFASCSDKNSDCGHVGKNVSWNVEGTFLLVLLSCFAGAAGIGGSCMVAGVMLAVFQFDTYLSAANTMAFIAAGSGTVIYFKLRDMGSTKQKVVIDYSFMLLTAGPLMFGVQLGIILNHKAPEWVLLLSITLISLLTCTDTIQKVIRLHYRLPNPSQSLILAMLPCLNPGPRSVLPESNESFYFSPSVRSNFKPSNSSFILIFISYLLYTCSTIRYQKVLLPITVYGLFTFLFSAVTAKYLIGIRKYPILGSENLTIWTVKKCFLAVQFASIAGVLVGFLGTGSGHIISPMIVSLSLLGNSTSITHSLCVFLATASGSFSHFVSGVILPQYFALFASTSILGNILGIAILRPKLIEDNKIPHLLGLISFLTFISLLTYFYLTIVNF